MKHAEKECEYEHCIEVFTPKRRDSRYCSASCRNMAGELRRQEQNRQRAEMLSRLTQRRIEGEVEEGEVIGYSQPAKVVQYVTQPSRIEKDIRQEMGKRMIALMDAVYEMRSRKQMTALELGEMVYLLARVRDSDLLRYVPNDNPIREFLSPIGNQISWWLVSTRYGQHNINITNEEILKNEIVDISNVEGDFWNWLTVARFKMIGYSVI